MNEPLLRISMLGRFTVRLGKMPLPPQVWPQRKTHQLLKLLLTERGRFFMQDQLIEALFSEMDLDKAVLSLHGRISELRRLLEPELKKGTDSRFILHVKLQGYCFSNDASCWLDTEEFQKFFQDAHEAEQAGRWLPALENYQQAVALYQGDFLAEDLYEEWTLGPRERWRELFLRALARLADVHARLRQLDRAIECCEQALVLQPWNEDIARQKMLYHYHAGAQALASQTYQQCVEALKTHLQAEPSHELRAVQEQISNSEVPAFPYVYPNNLPSSLTSFIGREREIIEVKRLLTDGATGRSPLQTRLLTLTGIGGSGKTRLALQVASQMLPDFPDGVWWTELGALTDPILVTKTVASALGLREHPNRSMVETLSDHLRLKQTLLVLDNCEHLIDACAKLAKTLLKNCANLQILATSRAALGLDGETVWSVPPLSMPDREPLPAPKILAQYEAVSLFITRALVSQPGFALTPENARDVARICQQLEGLPLAIELAAARLNVLSIPQIADRLADRFGLLASHRRAALPQHQTLRATMDWSWELLSENEKALLRRLSVFAGGFTLEAVEAVCGGTDRLSRGGSRTASTEILTRPRDALSAIGDRARVCSRETAWRTRARSNSLSALGMVYEIS
ncbi:winged helix-turn-helix domain-containing protein [Candidatus Acetothermia bacterium]|nr:winged helix-turn-helix domain-containing protein [Candidatus Acetothermia bacterium]